MNRHYKMFKKGKNWCYVAVATIAVLFGMATNSRVVKADISNNISPSLAQQVETDKVNSINKSEELQKTTTIDLKDFIAIDTNKLYKLKSKAKKQLEKVEEWITKND